MGATSAHFFIIILDMTLYLLKTKVQSPAHHIMFPAGKTLDRIEEFFVAGNAAADTPYRAPLVGQAQEGITSDILKRQDYLPGFVGLPFFSPRYVAALSESLKHEVEFHPCTIICEGKEHPYFLARLLKRLPLLNYEASNLNGPTIAFQGNFLRPNLTESFYLAREEHPLKCHVIIASEKFKTLTTQHKLSIGFTPITAK
jgi:hypothetical protein